MPIRDRIKAFRRVPASELAPNPKNWRTHPESQRAALRGVLDEVGMADALLAREGEGGELLLIDGHLRRETCPDAVLPVLVLDVNEAEADKLLATLDPLAAMAGANAERLDELLASLDVESEAVRGMLDELKRETNVVPTPPVEPVEVPVPNDAPKRCHPGDFWQLGEHRLLCGDSTKREHVDLLMGGEVAALCLTDPPYGIGEDYATHDDTREGLRKLVEQFLPIARDVSSVVLLTPGNGNQSRYPAPDWTLAWACPAGTGRGPWGFCCWQPVLAYGKDPYLASGRGCRPDFLNRTESAENDLGHPCPKPVGVWAWVMERGSPDAGDLIYDPFCGSGTSIVTAEQIKRRCYGIEISPAYCDVVLARWEKLTGRTAERVDE